MLGAVGSLSATKISGVLYVMRNDLLMVRVRLSDSSQASKQIRMIENWLKNCQNSAYRFIKI